MKQAIRHSIFALQLLLLVFSFSYLSLHIFLADHDHSHHSHSHAESAAADEEGCVVCEFSFTAFLEADPLLLPSFFACAETALVDAFEDAAPVQWCSNPRLRGPPIS